MKVHQEVPGGAIGLRYRLAAKREREAEGTLKQSLQRIRETCETDVQEALRNRDETIEKAWELRTRTSDRSWAVFLKETGA